MSTHVQSYAVTIRSEVHVVPTRPEIIDRLHRIVEPYVDDEEALASVDEDTNLLDDLNIDSMNLVDIILDVEEEFGIEIDDDAAEQMTTVGSAVDVIASRLGAAE